MAGIPRFSTTIPEPFRTRLMDASIDRNNHKEIDAIRQDLMAAHPDMFRAEPTDKETLQ